MAQTEAVAQGVGRDCMVHQSIGEFCVCVCICFGFETKTTARLSDVARCAIYFRRKFKVNDEDDSKANEDVIGNDLREFLLEKFDERWALCCSDIHWLALLLDRRYLQITNHMDCF